ncbi:vanin-like protein 1 isoform X2 [Phymastichus coffea]|uniref:vanin-like protein 1 isoform X2 n=1 Tax=Phymastichus coffea TaxID=108790 RepID=UPI00273C5F65|nr:vanin-like protein 1 isoform X2 [Phymastichus coffea]
MKLHITLMLLWWQTKTVQRSHYDSSYMAAVVEYSPIIYSMDNQNLGQLNAENYLKIIDKAASYAIDIIVFPESSLTISSYKNVTFTRSHLASYIPDPVDNIIPCIDKSRPYEYSFRSMSCAARDYQIYVLVNHREKVDCTPGNGCPNDGLLIYNTNVAFDRNGKVIARYRKYHLFHEVGVNRTKSIPTAFTTDFGVTFGTFICFDIQFPTPALTLIRDLAVTDILYPTHWFNLSPFLFATEIQASFAYGTDINLLASGISRPDTDNTGKQGYIDVISKNKRSNILLVAEIPKVIKGQRTRSIDRSKVHVYEFTKEEISTEETVILKEHYKVDPFLKLFSTELINLNDKSQSKTVCDRSFCCDFELTIDFDQSSITNGSQYYRYRFGAVNKTQYEEYLGLEGINSCAIIACANDTKDSCGIIFHNNKKTITPITFTSLKISTPNITNDNIFVLPSTYSQKMIPFNATDFSLGSLDFGNVSTYQLQLKKPKNNILAFAIFGRYSDLDRQVNLNSVV